MAYDSEIPVAFLLGTSGYVFTYAAPFRYPNTSCGLLFRTDVETQSDVTAIATPFDSGGIVRFYLPQDSIKVQTKFLKDHEMPVPAFRDYLVRVLAWLFDSPQDYLSGMPPSHGWPIQYAGGDERRHTFEVRIPKGISIDGTLLAAFMPVAVANQSWALPWCAKWKSQGADIVLFGSPTTDFRALQRECIDYLRRYMES